MTIYKQSMISTTTTTKETSKRKHGLIYKTPSISFRLSIIRNIELLEDGTIVSGGFATAKRWSTFSASLLNSFEGHSNWVNCIAQLDRDTIVTGSSDGLIKSWSLSLNSCLDSVPTTSPVYSFLVLKGKERGRATIRSDRHHIDDTTSQGNDKKVLLCGLYNGSIEARGDLSKGSFEYLYTFTQPAHLNSVSCLCELRDGRTVVSGSFDKTLKVWDLETRSCRRTLSEHMHWIWKVIELRDEGIVASASDDKKIKLWNVTSGICIRTLVGHFGAVYSLLELNDGTIASGSKDKTVRLWNRNTGECVSTTQSDFTICGIEQLRDGSIVIGGASEDGIGKMEIRQLRNNLVSLCCEVVAETYAIEEIEGVLPCELLEKCLLHYESTTTTTRIPPHS